MDEFTNNHKNPSRIQCEETIRHILQTELAQKGCNSHFKTAADFMTYFESLYPASDALTKQVQRAIKSMNMPKDEHGYFIVNKTKAQVQEEKEISSLFQKHDVVLDSLDNTDLLFLSAQPSLQDYLIHILETSELFDGKFITITKSSNGLLIYTRNRNSLLLLLESLMPSLD